MATRPKIEYYFSFISLWSYVGSRRLQQLVQRHNAEVVYKPIDLMHIFSISGGLPVKQRSIQRQAYRLLEMQRWCQTRNLPIAPHPKFYPADSSLAHRVFLAAIREGGHDSAAVQEIARRGLSVVWAEEGDIADPKTIVRLANESGLEGERLLAKAREDRTLAEEEEALTREAVDRQVFGAPFYFYENQPFWGQDRLEMLDDVIGERRPALLLSDYKGGQSPHSYLHVPREQQV
jgi:2-hydroxychromene-2-carboxylate isomerase